MSLLTISSKDVFSVTSEYLKSKSTLGVIFNAEHSSSNVSAETKLLPSSIWLKLLVERLIFEAVFYRRHSCSSVYQYSQTTFLTYLTGGCCIII